MGDRFPQAEWGLRCLRKRIRPAGASRSSRSEARQGRRPGPQRGFDGRATPHGRRRIERTERTDHGTHDAGHDRHLDPEALARRDELREGLPRFHETEAIITRALELGVNFIDTANTYAHGTNEEYIGEALRRLAVPREDIVLASKAYFNEGHLSRGRSSGRSRGP